MKKFISFLILFALAFTMLTACNNSSDESNVSLSEGTVTDAYMNENGEYVPRHEVKKMDQRTFTIIVRGAVHGTYQSDDFTTDGTLYGDLLNDAVKKRNDVVEKLYDVKLEVVKSDNINNDIFLDCSSSTGEYDAIMPTLAYLSTLAADSYLYDLRTLANFDDQAPWYDQNCSEAFSFSNQLYFTSGDITILNKVNTPSILFNKEMAQKYYANVDFYQLVRDKKWTFDKMVELASGVDSIQTADGSYSKENIYGMVGSYGDAQGFYGASGEMICGKDPDDLPYLAIGESDRSVNIAKKVLETMNDASKSWLIYAETFDAADRWETSFEVFYNGRALFRPSAFSATTKLRSRSNIEFGILPMPLMDGTQDQYYSYCGSSETAGIAIPISAKDPEFSAYMIEAYSAWAKNYITHAYYEVNLKTKDARDDESEEMLDIIFGNIVYDIGECYDYGGLSSMFYSLAQEGKSDVVSAIQSRKDQAQTKIDEMIDLYATVTQ